MESSFLIKIISDNRMSLISGRLILDHMLLPGKFRRNQIWSSKTKAGNKCALILSL